MAETKNRMAEIYRTKEELEKDVAERKRIEEELNKAHNELEQRVRERTTELAKANEALAAEIDERKRTEQERNLLLASFCRETGEKSHGCDPGRASWDILISILSESGQPRVEWR